MYIFGFYLEIWLAVVILIAILLVIALLVLVIWGLCSYKKYPVSEEKKRYAFFIPAKNEGNVISNVISSIRAMDYPQDKISIFILANNCSEDDTTEQTAKAMGEEVFVIKDESIKSVGPVLEKFFEYILERYGSYDEFDGYLRLDADNVVDKDYMSRMNDAYCANPTVVTSYRANKNFNDGIRASLTCMLVTQCMVAFRLFSGWGVNPIITGPGILIGSNILDIMGGWKCKTLSEDCELSALLCKLKIKVHFCYDAVFYDEQANKMKFIFRQRLRWTTGTSQVCAKYWPTMVKRVFSPVGLSALFLVIGLLPMGLISVIFTVIFGVISGVSAVLQQTMYPVVTWLIVTAAFNTIPGWFMGFITFIIERKRTKMVPLWRKAVYILFNPLGFMLQTVADFVRLFVKVTWKPILHGQQKTDISLTFAPAAQISVAAAETAASIIYISADKEETDIIVSTNASQDEPADISADTSAQHLNDITVIKGGSDEFSEPESNSAGILFEPDSLPPIESVKDEFEASPEKYS